MRRHLSIIVLGSVTALLALPLSAAAQSTPPPVDPEKHQADSLRIPAISTFAYTQNMHPLGYSPRVVPLANAQPGAGVFNSDLAFWGKTAYQGTYEGFRIIDVTEPDNPVEMAFVRTPCGSHTATGVPHLAHNLLLIYNSSSSGAVGCRGIDIIEVPLDDPSTATYLRFEPSGDPR